MKADLYQAAQDLSPTVAKTPEYQDHPIKFSEDILRSKLTDEQRTILRSVRDERITLVPSANSVGKTFSAAEAAVWWLSSFAPSKVVLTAAPPEDNLRRLLWGEISRIYETTPELLPDYLRGVPASMRISFGSQHWLEGRAIPVSFSAEQREAKFSGVHSPHLLYVVDEGDAVPPEIYRAIESCMSGEHDRMIVLFNPRNPSGAVYNMIREGVGNVISLTAFDHPNVVTGEEIIPGAVSRETTVRRISRWTRPLIEGEEIDEISTFTVPDYLDGETSRLPGGRETPPLVGGEVRKIMTPEFSYMVLGLYPTAMSNQLVDRGAIQRAKDRWVNYVKLNGEIPPKEIKPRTGQDVAEFGDDVNIIFDRYGGFVTRPIKWANVDPTESADRGAQHARSVGSEFHFVDATGIGSGVAPGMRKKNVPQAVGVKTHKSPTQEPEDMGGEFGLYRDQLFWSVREWLHNDPTAMLPPSETLEDDLLVLTYEFRSGKLRVMQKKDAKKLLGRSPDEGDALALTFAEPEIDDQFVIMPPIPVRGARRPGGTSSGREGGLSGRLTGTASKRRNRRRS